MKTDHQPAIEDQNSLLKNFPVNKRRTSKIARLPKQLRDLINDRLSDGLPYDEIAEELKQSTQPPSPYEISARNISDWYAGGYQDWLRHQDRLDLLASRFDFALDLAQNSQPDKLQELSLQLASIRLCEFLSELAISDPQTDPAIYLRLLSALPRISKEALNLQKYRDASATTADGRALSPKAPPATGSTVPTAGEQADHTEACRTALINQLDDIMGLKSYRNLPRSPAQSTTVRHPSPPADPAAVPGPAASGPAQRPDRPYDSEAKLQSFSSAAAVAPVSQPCPPVDSDAASSSAPSAVGDSSHSSRSPACAPAPAAPPTETCGNPRKPNPSPKQAAIQNQQARIPNDSAPNEEIPPETCLECGHPLPPLLSNGARPQKNCGYCKFPLPSAGSCREPSTEQCAMCRANLPRLLSNGQRPDHYCHRCGTPLPAPKP